MSKVGDFLGIGQPASEEPPAGPPASIQPDAEREPAERKILHLRGDQRASCAARHYFGPTVRRDGGPGRVWKFRHAEYDEAKDVTTAWFAPVAEYELNAVMAAIEARRRAQDG